MIVLRAALAAFGGAGLLTKAIVVGSMFLSLLTVYGVWHYKVSSAGYNRCIGDIAAGNKKAVTRAKNLRSAANDCNDRNGTWDATNAKCSN